MDKRGASARERRWIVLAEDARFVTLRRATDPDEAAILAAEAGLCFDGLGGWLVVMDGNPHVGPMPGLMQVRQLGNPGSRSRTRPRAAWR